MANVFRKFFNTETDYVNWMYCYGNKKGISLEDFAKGNIDGKKYYYVDINNNSLWYSFLANNNLYNEEVLDLSHFYTELSGTLLSSNFKNKYVKLGRGTWFYASVNAMPWVTIEINYLSGETVSCNQMSNLTTLIVHNCSKDIFPNPTTSFLVDCPKLTKVILNNFWLNNINLSASTLLSRQACIDLFKSLADLKSVSGTRSITLAPNVLVELSDEDKKIATDKGWVLA